jgi:phosphatidate cytidylyltransferase
MATEGTSIPSAPHGWFGSELGLRVVSATILGAITLFATYQGGLLFDLLWLVAGTAALLEWLTIAKVEPRWVTRVLLISGLICLTLTEPRDAVIGGGLAAIAALIFGKSPRDRLWALAAFACTAVLVLVPPGVRNDPALGIVGVLWIFAVVWATDIVAYFTGRALGGPKLWPRVSPKKTWSGFAGGLAAGTLAGVLVVMSAREWGWAQPLATTWVILLSMMGSVVGQAGDLAESALKRYFGVKDSGQLIPGHGGVMDRLDAFWAVALLVGLVLLAVRLGI